MRNLRLWLALALCTCMLEAMPARADDQLYDKPVYDPVSKHYFMLANGHQPGNIYRGINWANAYAQAQADEYKGVRGRLAVVDSLEVHQFLERTFHPSIEVWIGLRYWCQAQRLQAANGEYVTRSGFQVWDANWHQDVYACNEGARDKSQEYMPVAYSPVQKGFRWIGKGSHK